MKNITVFLLLICISALSYAQCFPDRHSTNWYDGWVSCDMSPNPVSDLGESHWILYDFKEVLRLGQLQIWNYNDPANLDRGMLTGYISTSMDKVNWETTGPHFFPQATGFNDYEGFMGPVINKNAQFMVITSQMTYGSACAGLSEVKVNLLSDYLNSQDQEDAVCFDAYVAPNPFSHNANVFINSTCPEPLLYNIRNMMGQLVQQGSFVNGEGQNVIQLINWQQPTGTYYLQLKQNGFTRYFSLLKTQ